MTGNEPRETAMWVRNAWYAAAFVDELEPGMLLARTVIERPLVLYRTASGDLVALEDRCCHRFAPLSRGRLERDDLRCMYHGMKFAPDGRCIEIPGQAAIPPEARVRSYPVRADGAWIWVWMGEAEAADPGLLPATVALDDPAWRLCAGQLDYAADYQLINDNLLDLTHLTFTHESTLGRDTPQWGETRPKITQLPRGLRSERWIEGFRAVHHLLRFGETLDIWHVYDYFVPGIFIQRTGWYPAGSAAAANGAAPEAPPLFMRCDEQTVTPQTARYAYTVGFRAGDGDDEFCQRMTRHAERAFREDREIIEAQQRVLDTAPDRRMLGTTSDAGLATFRRILARLAAQEAPQPPAAAEASAPRRRLTVTG